jgi:hypothetical protein
MNHKYVGTKGQNCVIGELSKLDIDIAYPLSDNLPFDLILIRNCKLYRAQIKTSEKQKKEGSITFSMRTTNWYNGKSKKYTIEDCDIFLCYDIPSNSLYVLEPSNFSEKTGFTIRTKNTKNNQVKRINYHEDFIVSKERLDKLLK